jgi:hypothetical protein
MVRFKITYKIWCLLFLLMLSAYLPGQNISLEPKSPAFFDSLDISIAAIQQQIPRLKQSHDISLFHLQRELDHSLFTKAYEEFVVDEDLFRAKDLVESRLERARFRKDQYSIDFYNAYKDNVYSRIKNQRMYYQSLFENEKNFEKKYFSITKTETEEVYLRAQRITDLALKYADENNFTETASYLKNFKIYTEARLFDIRSPYDLNVLTENQKNFEKVFIPMIDSDSISTVKEAEKLVDYCIQYVKFIRRPMSVDYLEQQKLAASTALFDCLERQGLGSTKLNNLTDQAVIARIDSLNPRGVYKWHECIIVINEFNPTSGFETVKKGEALINADNVLAAYLKKYKLCKSTDDLKFGYAYIIPYKATNITSGFLFHHDLQKWQYIACYTLINSPNFTREVIRFMPPIIFKDENLKPVTK